MIITLNQPFSFCQMGQRDNQEDSRFPNSNRPQDCKPFFIVCDGVGGSADGEVASMAVARTLGKSLNAFDWRQTFTQDDCRKALTKAYQALTVAAPHQDTDMATTLAMICFHKGGCSAVHIGDSRIYQYRPQVGLVFRSSDHSLVNELVHAGVISPEEALTHPRRSTINRYMAPDSDDEEHSNATWYTTDNVLPGDIFFICTDGVVDTIDDKSLEDIICGAGSDEEKCELIAQMSSDSDDNNTAFLVSVASVTAAEANDEELDDDSNINQTKRIIHTSPVAVDIEAEEFASDGVGEIVRWIKKKLNLN